MDVRPKWLFFLFAVDMKYLRTVRCHLDFAVNAPLPADYLKGPLPLHE